MQKRKLKKKKTKDADRRSREAKSTSRKKAPKDKREAIVKEDWFKYCFEKFVDSANADLKKALKKIDNNKKLTPEQKQAKKDEELKKSTENYKQRFNELIQMKDQYKGFYERIKNFK